MRRTGLLSLKLTVIWIGTQMAVEPLLAQGGRRSDYATLRELSLGRALDQLDLRPLRLKARKRNPDLTRRRLERLVWSNFNFVFLNKLNRSNFLIMPRPQRVLEKMVRILELNEQLETLLCGGPSANGTPREKRKLVTRVQELAGELHRTFSEYFLEIRDARLQIRFRRLNSSGDQFEHYLALCDYLIQLLSAQVERYFLSPEPSLVTRSEYEEFTVPVLAKGLAEVSILTRERLKE